MRFWGRGRFSAEKRLSPQTPSPEERLGRTRQAPGERALSKRSTSPPPDPLSRRVAGNRLDFSSRLVRPCEVGAIPCGLVVVTAADRAAATCRQWRTVRSCFSKRSTSPPDPLSRRVAGNRLAVSSRLVRPCEVGAIPCGLVVVTAADRAAATCRCFALLAFGYVPRCAPST